MATVFEKLEAETKGENLRSFSPTTESGARVGRVDERSRELGGVPSERQENSAEFEAIKHEVLALRW